MRDRPACNADLYDVLYGFVCPIRHGCGRERRCTGGLPHSDGRVVLEPVLFDDRSLSVTWINPLALLAGLTVGCIVSGMTVQTRASKSEVLNSNDEGATKPDDERHQR